MFLARVMKARGGGVGEQRVLCKSHVAYMTSYLFSLLNIFTIGQNGRTLKKRKKLENISFESRGVLGIGYSKVGVGSTT